MGGDCGWVDSAVLKPAAEDDGAAATRACAKLDKEKVRKALDAWMTDLAKDVLALSGVGAGQSPANPDRRFHRNPPRIMGLRWWAVQGSNL